MKLVDYRGHWVPQGSEKAWARYANRAKDMQFAVDQCAHLRTVVQAGGNIGAWPIWLSHQFTEVITFEPERANYVCLERNCEQYKNIESHHAALGAQVGFADLRVCKSIGSHHLIMRPGNTRILTIDGFNLEHCDLIVLDTEGSEALALQGAAGTIARCRPVVMLESKGHGEKKGFGLTHDDVLKAIPGYILVDKIRHDFVYVPPERISQC